MILNVFKGVANHIDSFSIVFGFINEHLFVFVLARKGFYDLMMLSWQEELSKEFGIPVESQRFWVWAKRQNSTYRPSRPLTLQEERTAVSGMPILNVVLVFDVVRVTFKLFPLKKNK